MATPNLKKMAEELEQLLTVSKPIVSAPVIDESYRIAAAEPAPAEAPPNNDHLIPQLVRSVVEYTLTRSPDGASPGAIGGAITAGINVAVERLELDRSKVVEAVGAFLDDLSESVHNSLVE